MALPDLNDIGDLPEGIYKATIDEVIIQFGSGTAQRKKVTERLLHIYQLVKDTNHFQRLLIYGSYITSKQAPNDIDVVIIFDDDFDITACSDEVKKLLDHHQASNEFGASIFYIRPSLILQPLDEFIEGWQFKRDGTRRGIIEVRNDSK